MDFLRPVKAFDRHQQGSRWLAIPVAVIKKFGDDQAGGSAALVAYYAFFSLFPLLLVFVTVLGFVLNGDPHAQHSVEKSLLGQFPIISDQIQGHTLQGHAFALVIGSVTSLLAGLGVTQAAQNALNRVWAVPYKERPNFLQSRLRGLVLLLALGGLFLIASVASGLVSGGLGGPLLKVAGYVVSLVLNFALFFASFKLLSSIDVEARSLVWGAAVAAVAWEILEAGGGIYIKHVVAKSTNTYGTFAFVIGALAWLHLGAQITMYAAEINVVLARRLYPRSLFGPPETRADQDTLRALAEVEERSEEEQIEVAFDAPDAPATPEALEGAEPPAPPRTGGPEPLGA